MRQFEAIALNLPDGFSLETLRKRVAPDLWRGAPELAVMIALELNGFDHEDYLDRYKDVREAGMDPVQHYVLHGAKEGRSFRWSQSEAAPDAEEAQENETAALRKLFGLTERPSIGELLATLEPYDVISFDIFDTALLRRVEFPADIFRIMGRELNWRDFRSLRQDMEKDARQEKFNTDGHTEISLAEIYALLNKYNGVAPQCMQREIELEKFAAIPNPYILTLYQNLLARGKKIVFSSDMYLPKDAIAELLKMNGYASYDAIYLSNDLKLHKGDGGLQKRLLRDYKEQRIIHIGDNKFSDVEQSEKAGLESLWHPACALPKRNGHYDNLAGSLYRAITGAMLNNGLLDKDQYYIHGFKCGGIIASGYCNFINQVARANNVEKILFCGRDCQIIQKVYDSFFRKYPNSYVETSRNALMSLSIDYYTNYVIWGQIFRYWDARGHLLTIGQLLGDTGYAWLIPYLEQYDINQFAFCPDTDKTRFRKFMLEMIPHIRERQREASAAAKLYYGAAIGNAKSLLIADVGWSGTCAEALELFAAREINPDIKAVGTVICAGDTVEIAANVAAGKLVPYISGPGINADFHEFMHPRGWSSIDVDKRHLPLEYLFTATCASISGYALAEDGAPRLLRADNLPQNAAQIESMQAGIYDFSRLYTKALQDFNVVETISACTAFAPLKECIEDDEYSRTIYGDFWYDACTVSHGNNYNKFSALFAAPERAVAARREARLALLISPELKYTGALNALLALADALRGFGFGIEIWSANDGPYRGEFEKNGIPVSIVRPDALAAKDSSADLSGFDLCVCNTIETAEYLDYLPDELPSIWFIHEATNITDFCRERPERFDKLRKFANLYCVSQYAADSLATFTAKPAHILHNTVPDTLAATPTRLPGSAPKIKFCQLGTMERRKGYDVLLKAWRAMPRQYREKSELHFAGRFIHPEAPFCEWLFNEIDKEAGVFYHGIIDDSALKFRFIGDMDVVVVASRDESCSLVALEGAMLARPLLVTENVGAKYLVSGENGAVVKTGDVESLAAALIAMIDRRDALAEMGRKSRAQYEQKASLAHYKQEVAQMLRRTCPDAIADRLSGDIDAVISLTSWPKRIGTILPCLQSLLAQKGGNFPVELWLSEEDFPWREAELPADLLALREKPNFAIRWTPDNLGPHKKYYYAMREHRDVPLITADDDAVYASDMASALLDSWKRHPHCVSCHRANMMMFRKNGAFRKYEVWPQDFRGLIDAPSLRIIPTGAGGALYPPAALPDMAFDAETIKKLCLYGDDLWLKFMTMLNGYPAVVARERRDFTLIEGSQDSALWKENINHGNNDMQLQKICAFLGGKTAGFDALLEKARGDF